jgi:hypothetical protein
MIATGACAPRVSLAGDGRLASISFCGPARSALAASATSPRSRTSLDRQVRRRASAPFGAETSRTGQRRGARASCRPGIAIGPRSLIALAPVGREGRMPPATWKTPSAFTKSAGSRQCKRREPTASPSGLTYLPSRRTRPPASSRNRAAQQALAAVGPVAQDGPRLKRRVEAPNELVRFIHRFCSANRAVEVLDTKSLYLAPVFAERPIWVPRHRRLCVLRGKQADYLGPRAPPQPCLRGAVAIVIQCGSAGCRPRVNVG